MTVAMSAGQWWTLDAVLLAVVLFGILLAELMK
jgi:hypothetical protein